MGEEIGGHNVSGHVHTVADVAESQLQQDGTACIRLVPRDPAWMKYIFTKGFVAVDGCSLTVGETTDGDFKVYLIPETLRMTTLGFRKTGDQVNIEVDAGTQAIVDTVERVLQQKGLA